MPLIHPFLRPRQVPEWQPRNLIKSRIEEDRGVRQALSPRPCNFTLAKILPAERPPPAKGATVRQAFIKPKPGFLHAPQRWSAA